MKIKEFIKLEPYTPKSFLYPVKDFLFLWFLSLSWILMMATNNSHIELSENSTKVIGTLALVYTGMFIAGIAACELMLSFCMKYRSLLNMIGHYMSMIGGVVCFALVNVLPLEPYSDRLLFVTILGTFSMTVFSYFFNREFSKYIKNTKRRKKC